MIACKAKNHLKRCLSNKSYKSREKFGTSPKPFEDIPGPKPLPVIGNLWRYLPLIGDYKVDSLFENAQYNKKRYGPIVRENIMKNLTILHLFDPRDIETFVRLDSKYPARRSHRALGKYRRDRPDRYLDGGLFPENGKVWYDQRKKFESKLMNPSELSKNIPKLEYVGARMLSQMSGSFKESNQVIINDFQVILNKWSLANALILFAETDFVSLGEAELEAMIRNLTETLDAIDYTEVKSQKWESKPTKCPFYRMLVHNQDTLHDFVSEQVEKAKHNQLTNGGYSYLHTWLHIDKIDSKSIVAFIMDCMLAGLHTTSYTLAFLLYHVSKLDNGANILRHEFSMDNDLAEMKFLSACLKETMRLNPVSIGSGRITQTDNLVLGGYAIPPGTMTIAHTQSTSMDDYIYRDAQKFIPDRWAHYRTLPREEKPPPYASQPFGFWPRACIGKRAAELQIKLMAMRLFENFDFEFENPIKTKSTLIHNIDGNIKVKMTMLRDNA